MNSIFTGLRHRLAHIISLHSPSTTFSHAIVGIVAITQSKDDFVGLFGAMVGAKAFILAKWVGAYCTAVSAVGRSPLAAVDAPKDVPNAG